MEIADLIKNIPIERKVEVTNKRPMPETPEEFEETIFIPDEEFRQLPRQRLSEDDFAKIKKRYDGWVGKYGIEALAWYVPFHIKKPNLHPWGIYISNTGLQYLENLLKDDLKIKKIKFRIKKLAKDILVSHERFHFMTEVCCTFLEFLTDSSVYLQLHEKRVNKKSFSIELATKYDFRLIVLVSSLSRFDVFEEALANANVLMSDIYKYKGSNRGQKLIEITRTFMDKQPEGYRDYKYFKSANLFRDGKNVLAHAILDSSNISNSMDMLFNCDKTFHDCVKIWHINDFSLFNIQYSPMVKNRRIGIDIYLPEREHGLPHIHVFDRKQKLRTVGKYYLDTLKPLDGYPSLTSRQKKDVSSLMATKQFQKKLINKGYGK